jgi:polyferredoxin
LIATLREEVRTLATGRTQLRKFGLTIGGVLVLLGTFWWWRGQTFGVVFIAIGAVLVFAGAIYPAGLRFVYIGWMSFALFLGAIVLTVLLTLFFYLIVTPTGLIARVFGKDFLTRKLERATQSYWIMRDRSQRKKSEDFERQF